ncbi:MAG: class I SAM-dependent methyltransferase [Planctomycetota bacterium]|jgi:SAM-dependent methyltransferase|nr:class I SAM-dependent methyltransferase [Planctomycetota bacterium]
MSSLPGPATDWDLVHRWEWFRRASWRRGFRAAIHGQGGGPARAFTDLSRSLDAKALLDASCGLGRRAILLAEKGVDILGSDISGTAIGRARELARDENAPVTFFRSAWNDLPKNMPHHFDGILVTGLNLEPSWDNLGTALVGVFHALHPGGFLMFIGATENEEPAAVKEKVEKEWASQPPERVEWFFREGAASCTLVKLRTRAADYIDDRLLYVSEENGESRLESTVIRRPAYWTWEHWSNLARMAGFCHLETRAYPGYGLDGGALNINVAWKEKDAGAQASADSSGRGAEYSD